MPPTNNQDPIQVLHVVGKMDRGGTETWLINIMRHINRRRFRFDFLVHAEKPGAYDEEIRQLGSLTIPCTHPRRPWRYARDLSRILARDRPYDILHSHVGSYSGWVLRQGKKAGVPIRIAHSHSILGSRDGNGGPWRRAYQKIMQLLISRYATYGLAFSRQAAAALFGDNWLKDRRWRLLPHGIDLRSFQEKVDPKKLRQELGIPSDAFVVGHVGRLAAPKNHDFLLDIFQEIVRRESKSMLLLVGDGPLRCLIERKAARLNLTDRLVIPGVRGDVPRLMVGVMDSFLFPSLMEGLGLAVIEAQAAGLPCIISDRIPPETDIAPERIHRLSLKQLPWEWADMVMSVRHELPVTPGDILKNSAIKNHDIKKSADRLCEFYLQSLEYRREKETA